MSWLAPWFLAGLAGIALPIWLHRFARKTDQKHQFASSMFLEASEIRRNRRREIRYWLLLAARVLLVLLLGLAFAGPQLRSRVLAGPQGATLHAIVLDTSMSMHQDGAWQRAREQANALIGALKGADRAMLLAADYRLRVLQEPVFAGDAGQLRAALQTLEPGYARLDDGAMVAGTAARCPTAPGEHLVVHFITDLQQSASPLRFADLAPPPGVRFELVDVAPPKAANLHVSGVREDARDPGAVRISVDGDAAALAKRELVLEVNGKQVERRPLKAGQPLPLEERFVLNDLGPGEHRLTARLEPADDLPEDDAYYALLRHVEPKVLVIAASNDGDDAQYLRAALGALPQPHFSVETAQPGELAKRQLGDFAAVIVSDAGLLSGTPADALAKYVQGGGAALLTLGARAAQLDTIPVSGAKRARGDARQQADQPARVGEMELSHPVLREPGTWRQVRFLKHVATVPPAQAHVLMRFTNGTPLMWEQAPGQGRLLVFASPLDREWNDLAIHPLFVRFVSEATAWLAGTRVTAASGTVGAMLDASNLRHGGAQVFDPRGQRASMLGDGDLRWVPELPGFYELRGGGHSDFVAVNPDPRESRLAPLDQQARDRWLALQPQPGAAPVAVAADSGSERLVPVWFWLLLAAAALAFLEPLVANYHLNIRREQRA
ncbi:MAG TPA: BatA domain-containing protein [Steroidobacteraceae bacterium]|nr:BatA domain-containing protein [Steroidobacteraceae bacterium]